MNELSHIKQTMSSREIAQLTGKEHRHVLRDCDVLNDNYDKLGLPKIEQGYYTHPNTGEQQHREYLLTKMQTFDLLTGYRVDLRIKVNRRWEELESKQLDFSNPDNVLMLVQNWKEEKEKRERIEERARYQEEQLKLAAPKVALMNKILDTDEKIDIGQAAKILNLPFGRNTLFKKLREKGVFFRNRNEPKQDYIKRGFFDLKEKWIDRNEHDGFVVVKVLVTQKGLDFINSLFNYKPSKKQMAPIQ